MDEDRPATRWSGDPVIAEEAHRWQVQQRQMPWPPDEGYSHAAMRVRRSRAEFLPFIVMGAVIFGALAGLVASPVPEPPVSEELVAVAIVGGTLAGIVVGLTAGWALLTWLARVAANRTIPSRLLSLAILALSLVAYLLAGLAAGAVAGVPAALFGSQGQMTDVAPAAAGVLAVIIVAPVTLPLGWVFARRERGVWYPRRERIRRATWHGSLQATVGAYLGAGGPSRRRELPIGRMSAVGSVCIVMVVLLVINFLDVERYTRAVENYGPALMACMVVAWGALTIGIWALIRRVRKPKSDGARRAPHELL